METGNDGSRSLRTRSQVAPDWTVQESLILVNEIAAVESECLNTLSSFQKWKIIVENCNALEVNRNLNQCRRKWDSLLSDYRKINNAASSFSESVSLELFKAIDCHVNEQRCDTDPDSDLEAQNNSLLIAVPQSGSKRQRHRTIPQKCRKERVELKRCVKDEDITSEVCSSKEKVEHRTEILEEAMMPDEMNQEEEEHMVAAKLKQNAELINALVQRHSPEDKDYRKSDLVNVEAIQNDFIRHKSDQLIICLGNLADALEQLCTLVK